MAAIIDGVRVPIINCDACKSLAGNPKATRCVVCDKPLCVDHITFVWDNSLKRAKDGAYYCPAHNPREQ